MPLPRALAALLLAAFVLLPSTALAEDWPQRHGGPERTGSRGVSSLGTGEPLWETEVGAFPRAPAVADGAVFVVTGSFREPVQVRALDLETGVQHWRRPLDVQGWPSGPVVAGDVVYTVVVTGDGEGNATSRVHALDAGTGAPRWSASVPGRSEDTLAVHDGTLLLTACVFPACQMRALDAATGETRWNVSAPDGAGRAIAAAEGVALTQGYSALWAYDVASGDVRWRARVSGFGSPFAAPAIANGAAYWPASDGRLHALDLHSGEERWNVSLGNGSLSSTPAIADGRIYVGGADGFLHALDAGNGSELWRAQAWSGHRFGSVHSGVAVAQGAAFYVDDDARSYIALLAVDTRNGTVAWSREVGSNDGAAPVVADGRVLVPVTQHILGESPPQRSWVVAYSAGAEPETPVLQRPTLTLPPPSVHIDRFPELEAPVDAEPRDSEPVPSPTPAPSAVPKDAIPGPGLAALALAVAVALVALRRRGA